MSGQEWMHLFGDHFGFLLGSTAMQSAIDLGSTAMRSAINFPPKQKLEGRLEATIDTGAQGPTKTLRPNADTKTKEPRVFPKSPWRDFAKTPYNVSWQY